MSIGLSAQKLRASKADPACYQSAPPLSGGGRVKFPIFPNHSNLERQRLFGMQTK